MKNFLAIFAFALLATSSVGHASFLIEPYLGYHLGKFEQGAKYDTNGSTYGGRLGFSKLGLQFGVDYMAGKWDIDTGSSDFNGSASNLGVFAAYDFPILLRVFGTYFFDAELKDAGKFEGNMIRLGVGLSPIPLLDINIEYMTATYDKWNGTSVGSDDKLNMYGVSVSIPFTL